MIVHYAPRPVLVVPYPLLTAERADLETGPLTIGWDGSPGAQRAVAVAERLLPSRRIVLVSVHDDADRPPAPLGREVVESHLTGVHVETGRTVTKGLLAEADRLRAAAVVVGSRGRAAVPEILLGSVAMATLHHSPRPVLVVPRAASRGHDEPAGT
jgi:nucleotide-binding universal stress UspA family protein